MESFASAGAVGFFLGSSLLTMFISLQKNKIIKPVSKYGFPNDQIDDQIETTVLEGMRLQIDQNGDDFLELLCHQDHAFRTCTPFKIRELLAEILVSETMNPEIQRSLNNLSTVPEWVDWDLLEQGQCVFLRYPTISAMALMYYSLIGGFAAPKIIKVLNSTGYLSINSDATYRRLNETFDMVIKCLEGRDALRYGNSGWIAVTAVRLLHSRVRRNLLNSKLNWDTSRYGLPINQEDMMGTLLSFSINVLDSLHLVGVPMLTGKDEMAFLHLWRYVGHLIGVRDEFNPLTSLNRARGSVQSVVSHLLHPDDSSVILAAHMIRSVSYRNPYPWSPQTHSEAVRFFLGNPLTDALHIKPSFFHRAYFWSIIALMKTVYWVSYCIPWGGSFPQSHNFTLSHPLIQRNLKRLQESVEKALALPSPQSFDDTSSSNSATCCPYG
jgi:hypothetical protein